MTRTRRIAVVFLPLGLLLGGCTGDETSGEAGSTQGSTGSATTSSSSQSSSSTGGETCTDPSTDIGGDYYESRTLYRACSPYHLVNDFGFYGDGVVLTIEDGVQILADQDAGLRIDDGAQLVAGIESGQKIVLEPHRDAPGPWQAIHLLSTGVVHELHAMTIRGGKGTTAEEGEAVLYLDGEALLDHVTFEQPVDVGIRVHRDGARLAPGSNNIVVEDAGGYPIVMDAQNLGTLPANQEVSSADPAKNRVLIFGGNDGGVIGDVSWLTQNVDIEIGVDLHIGTEAATGTLQLPSPQKFLLRANVDFYVDNGKLMADGGMGCKDDATACGIVLDAVDAGMPWHSVLFITDPNNTVASGSVVRGVRFANGGGNQPMVTVTGPGGGGVIGDCAPTATVEDCRFEGGSCLSANDSQNQYATLNSFVGCTADVKCD